MESSVVAEDDSIKYKINAGRKYKDTYIRNNYNSYATNQNISDDNQNINLCVDSIPAINLRN